MIRVRSCLLLFACLLLGACAAGGGLKSITATPAIEPGATHLSSEQLDPWQPFNRRMHRLNSTLDRLILRPVARGYVKVVPKPVRVGVSNFFDNLQQPVTTLNLILQGRPRPAAQSAGRFMMNITLGAGGILDPATAARLPRHQKDFGQTFARWGWKESRYLVLPVFGPGTVRDSVGKGVGSRASPVGWLAEQYGPEFSVLYGVNARASALAVDAFMEGATDEYLLVRDAFLQRRRCQIVDCSEDVPDYLLPDYEFEVPDLDALGD